MKGGYIRQCTYLSLVGCFSAEPISFSVSTANIGSFWFVNKLFTKYRKFEENQSFTMQTKEKKEYPSQQNTKTISTRVPLQNYVDLLQESMNKSISLSDLLLMKIYDTKSEIGNFKKDLNKKEEDKLSMIISNEDLLNIKGNWILEEPRISIWNNIVNKQLDKEGFIKLIDTLLVQIQDYKTQEEEPKIADINDVKTQLTILIDNIIDNIKDRRNFRKEIFDLLNELQEIEESKG